MADRDRDRSFGESLEDTVEWIGQEVKEAWDDARITAEIRSALYGRVPVTGLEVQVSVDEGVVTLRGEVASDWQKQEAERIARALCPSGVRRIVNEIRVNPNLPPIPPA
ncbi:MAG TPA: BON domain-containing protein [Chloroflexota bacterium]|nr:BON domain-containing protein [Chloroflexota bacterium]